MAEVETARVECAHCGELVKVVATDGSADESRICPACGEALEPERRFGREHPSPFRRIPRLGS